MSVTISLSIYFKNKLIQLNPNTCNCNWKDMESVWTSSEPLECPGNNTGQPKYEKSKGISFNSVISNNLVSIT